MGEELNIEVSFTAEQARFLDYLMANVGLETYAAAACYCISLASDYVTELNQRLA